jgi:hypothetical protein
LGGRLDKQDRAQYFSGLDGEVAQQELDLLKIAAILAASQRHTNTREPGA